MSSNIEDLTVSYEEDGLQLVKELDKVVLSKGAWTTILFRYQNLNRTSGEFSHDMYSIRRYQKRQGSYIPRPDDEADMKAGRITREQALELVECLFLKAQEIGSPL